MSLDVCVSAFFIIVSLAAVSVHRAAEARVFMVLMDDDAVVSFKESGGGGGDVKVYKEILVTGHDNFLQSLLPGDSYTKLYSYTHLINGFAVHTDRNQALDALLQARGVRAVHEDVRMAKQTTHTPEFLGIPEGAWPQLGGGPGAGDGVVVGMLDSGINPDHPSFTAGPRSAGFSNGRFRGRCVPGDRFPPSACNGKIVSAAHFSRGAKAAGDFNASRDYDSPFDADGHGSHTAATAAGNYEIPVIVNGFNYGNASGMAPGARIAVYKALFSFGGYMSDVVAAVDQAVEDGVDILSLSIGPQSVPAGPASFLNTLDMELLFAAKAGVLVLQAAGNEGPSPGTVLSFSPWIVSVAASTTDRKYSSAVVLGSGQSLSGTGLSPATPGGLLFLLAAAADLAARNATFPAAAVESCQSPEYFNRALARNKIIICTYSFDFAFDAASVRGISSAMMELGAAGFVVAADPDSAAASGDRYRGATVALPLPGIVLNTVQASGALWDYYNSNTMRRGNGFVSFRARARIQDGRNAVYTGQGPVVASYSSRGPDVNNVQLQTADVLKPDILAPGSLIWAAWSPTSEEDQYSRGQDFALLSGTSMATPHVAGVAALVKQKHPGWSPAAVASAMMTSASATDRSGAPVLAQGTGGGMAAATPFDLGAGVVNPAGALDPGLVFDAGFPQYVQFLCAVPGVDEESVRRAVGEGCPSAAARWCSDLNAPSVTVANLVGSRRVARRATNVGGERETYQAVVREPMGVAVTVAPRVFTVGAGASRTLRMTFRGTEASNAFSFGEVLLVGDRGHQVRLPLAVYVTSTLMT